MLTVLEKNLHRALSDNTQVVEVITSVTTNDFDEEFTNFAATLKNGTVVNFGCMQEMDGLYLQWAVAGQEEAEEVAEEERVISAMGAIIDTLA